MPAPGVLRVLSRPEPSLERLQRRHGVSRGATTSVAPIGPDPRSHGATRAGAICVGLLLPPRVQVRREAPRWRRRQRRRRQRRRRRRQWHRPTPIPPPTHTLAAVAARDGRGGLGSRCGGWRRACGGGGITIGQEAGAGGREGVGGPQEAEPPPPSHEHVHASCPWSTVSFDYKCATVRCSRVYIKLLLAQSIINNCGTSPGCLPPARGAAR